MAGPARCDTRALGAAGVGPRGSALLDTPRPAKASPAPELFGELDPEPRLLMGPGPVDVYPRVLRAMSVALQGQFDPQFTAYMAETMALYRQVFRTANHWTLLIDGTARAGIEACLASTLAPGDKLLVPIFGRFGHLKVEIGRRLGAEVASIETDWGRVFEPDAVEAAILQPPAARARHQPRRYLHHHAAAARRDRRRCAAGTRCCSTSTARPRSAATPSRWTPGRSTSPRPACRSACRGRRAPRPSRSPTASPS